MSVHEQTFHVGDAGSNPAGDAYSYEISAESLTPISPQAPQSQAKPRLATRGHAREQGSSCADGCTDNTPDGATKAPTVGVDGVLARRFWARVDVGDPGSCWLWKGRATKFGYGVLNVLGPQVPAHVVAYELANARAVALDVLHSCDNRRCCNPSHLSEGTKAENSDDMMRRGRNADQRGERNGNAKLSRWQVQRIRQRYTESRKYSRRSGLRLTHASLAKEYNVSLSAICHALSGANWQDARKNEKAYGHSANRPRRARFSEFTLPTNSTEAESA